MARKPFSHIVVGAGLAGCVVAVRLVENDEYNVLLIEAGPDYEDNYPKAIRNARRVPMKGQTDGFDSKIDRNVEVDVLNSTMTVPQARVMGGGSSINGGTALRNSQLDCNEWTALGNSAWSFENVYPVYESMEDDAVRGLAGPHPIQRASGKEMGKIQQAFITGAIESGFPYALDQNETGAEGVSPSPVCRRGDQRISSANTFVDPNRARLNFTIMSEALVDKVTFDGTRATSVILADGTMVTAGEVVVCAGAIFTPAILQRSGVGPAHLLSEVGIQSVVNLPVGLNLSDHPCIPIVARPKQDSYEVNDYSLHCNARWSSTTRPGAINFQLVCFSYLYIPQPDPGVHQGRGLGGMVSGHVSGVGCNLNKPASLGYVAIRSHSCMEQPHVAPAYLSTSHDQLTARELVRKGYQVMQSTAMQNVMGPPLPEVDILSNQELDS